MLDGIGKRVPASHRLFLDNEALLARQQDAYFELAHDLVPVQLVELGCHDDIGRLDDDGLEFLVLNVDCSQAGQRVGLN